MGVERSACCFFADGAMLLVARCGPELHRQGRAKELAAL